MTSNFYVQTIIGANIVNIETNVDINRNDETSTTTTTSITLGAVNSTKSTRNRQIHNNNNGTSTSSFKGEYIQFIVIFINNFMIMKSTSTSQQL